MQGAPQPWEPALDPGMGVRTGLALPEPSSPPPLPCPPPGPCWAGKGAGRRSRCDRQGRPHWARTASASGPRDVLRRVEVGWGSCPHPRPQACMWAGCGPGPWSSPTGPPWVRAHPCSGTFYGSPAPAGGPPSCPSSGEWPQLLRPSPPRGPGPSIAGEGAPTPWAPPNVCPMASAETPKEMEPQVQSPVLPWRELGCQLRGRGGLLLRGSAEGS